MSNQPEIRWMGEFFDLLLRTTQNGQGRIFLEDLDTEWKKKARRKFRSHPFNYDGVERMCLCVSELLGERLRGICTNELYRQVQHKGHAFLEEIGRVAAEHGVDFGARGTDRNVTPIEVAEFAGVTKVVAGKAFPNTQE